MIFGASVGAAAPGPLAPDRGPPHNSSMPKKAPPKRSAPPRPKAPSRAGKGRNEFGDPRDTLYAGGTPLFDEMGGGAKRPAPGKRKPAR